jgi:excinuclease UvrABC helicase subunit UvrB
MSATTTISRGTFRVRGDIIEVYPSYEVRLRTSCSATRWTSSHLRSAHGEDRRHDKIAVYLKSARRTARADETGGGSHQEELAWYRSARIEGKLLEA